jgi:putative phosphoesterase
MSEALHLQRIGVIGDIHAEDHYLESVLKFLTNSSLDLIMAVGDVADGRGSVDLCCQLLQHYRVATVAGNHERWFLAEEARDVPDATPLDGVSSEARAYLSSLPKLLEFETAAGRLLLCHGLGEYDMGGVKPGEDGDALEANFALLQLMLKAKYRFVVNGHTHQRMVRKFDHLTIINAGTLFHKHKPGFLIADFEDRSVQYYDLNHKGQVSKAEIINLFVDTGMEPLSNTCPEH